MQSWATFLCYCVVCLVTQLCPTLCNLMSCSLPDPYDHGIFFRQEYWSGWPFHPPRNLFIQWLNWGLLYLLHCKRILYPLSHQGSHGPDLIPFPRHWQDSWVHLMRDGRMVYKTQETLEDKPSSWTRNLKHHSLRKLRTMILKQQFL